MEIVFFLTALSASAISCYLVARIAVSHDQLMRMYKRNDDLFMFHLILVIILAVVFFAVLCAINNTFFHLPYFKG